MATGPPDPDSGQDDTNIAFTHRLARAMMPWSTGHAYLNFIGDDGLVRVEAAYGRETYRRRLRD